MTDTNAKLGKDMFGRDIQAHDLIVWTVSTDKRIGFVVSRTDKSFLVMELTSVITSRPAQHVGLPARAALFHANYVPKTKAIRLGATKGDIAHALITMWHDMCDVVDWDNTSPSNLAFHAFHEIRKRNNGDCPAMIDQYFSHLPSTHPFINNVPHTIPFHTLSDWME